MLKSYCMSNRDIFAREALAQIPKILTLLDRNSHSPTYGCFDRTFWQYKVIDFPAGMSQEFVYPLALAYHCDLPDNIYYQQPVIKEWVRAAFFMLPKVVMAMVLAMIIFPTNEQQGQQLFLC